MTLFSKRKNKHKTRFLKLLEEDAKEEFGLKDVIKLASNENPLGPSPKAIEAVKNAVLDASKYPDQHQVPLRAALSKRFGLPSENFIVGNGSDEVMLMIALTFLEKDDEVVISRNTFSVYEFVTKLMGASPVYVDLKDLTYDLQDLASAVSKKTKLIFLCNPNSPTGTIVKKDALEKFIKAVPENVIVVVDEAYGEYADLPDYRSAAGHINKRANLIVLKTFSKIYGLAGLRIGYGVSSKKIIDLLNLVKMPFNVNRIGQIAALAALDDDGFVARSNKNNAEGKEYLYSEFSKMGLKFLKTQANFVFVDLQRDSEKIFVELMSRGIIIRPLSSFGLPKAIRVTVGTPSQNKKFIQALKKVL